MHICSSIHAGLMLRHVLHICMVYVACRYIHTPGITHHHELTCMHICYCYQLYSIIHACRSRGKSQRMYICMYCYSWVITFMSLLFLRMMFPCILILAWSCSFSFMRATRRTLSHPLSPARPSSSSPEPCPFPTRTKRCMKATTLFFCGYVRACAYMHIRHVI